MQKHGATHQDLSHDILPTNNLTYNHLQEREVCCTLGAKSFHSRGQATLLGVDRLVELFGFPDC